MDLEQLIKIIKNPNIDITNCIALAEHLGVSLECVIVNIYWNEYFSRTNPEKTGQKV